MSDKLGWSKAALAGAGLVFLFAFTLYFVTLPPTVTLVDSGELLLAAYTMGVAHPPGFPLYVILAHLAAMVPLGSVATRVHLVSALFAALAAAAVTLASNEALLTLDIVPRKAARKKSKKAKTEKVVPVAAPSDRSLPVILSSVAAGLLFAFSRTLWGYATIAEVYTLNIFLTAAVFWLMFRWRRTCLNGEADYRLLYIAAFVFGLGICDHHVTMALTLPGLAVLVYETAGTAFFASRKFIYSALISLSALSIYAYLPIAASRSPLMNWGNTNSLERVWWHFTGKQYQSFFDGSFSRISELLNFAGREFAPALAAIGPRRSGIRIRLSLSPSASSLLDVSACYSC